MTWGLPSKTLSTREAEYVAAASCVCHAVWLRRILRDVHCFLIWGEAENDTLLWYVSSHLRN